MSFGMRSWSEYGYTIAADLRCAMRSHRRFRTGTAVAVVTLAVGIGANATLFRLTDVLVVRSLPVRDPDRLVQLAAPGPWSGWRRGTDTFSNPAFEELRDENRVFEGILARYRTSLTLQRGGGASPERVRGVLVSGSYFRVLGVGAETGRLLRPEDDRLRNGHPVAVLSERYWRRSLGADLGVVGSTIRLNGYPMTVVGVSGRGFDGIEVGTSPDVFVPLAMKPLMTPTWDHLDNRRSNFLHVLARLRTGVTRTEAESSVNLLYRRVLSRDLEYMSETARFADEYRAKPLHLEDARRGVSGLRPRSRTALLALHGMLGFLLVVVCLNVAGLLLARGADESRALLTHAALGAPPRVLIRRVWVEMLTLGVPSGLLGLLLASWVSTAVGFSLPAIGEGALSLSLWDGRAAVFSLAVSLLAGLLFGWFPARAASRVSPAAAFRDGPAAWGGGSRRGRTGEALVIAQIALAFVLVTGSGLFARSLANVSRVDVGFEVSNLTTFSIDPALSGYGHGGTIALMGELRRALSRQPGVESVAAAEVETLSDERWTQTIGIEGYDAEAGGSRDVGMNAVSPSYFETMGMTLLEGRDLSEADRAGAPKVAVVNASLARHFFGDRSAVGRRFRLGDGNDYDVEIVGVVADGKYRDLKEEPLRFAFIPYMQDSRISDVSFYLRTGDGGISLDGIRAVVQSVDAALPIFDAGSMSERRKAAMSLDRVLSGLAVTFGAMTCLLAGIGLYGLTSHSVDRRTRELGLRMALGARREDLIRMILFDASTLLWRGIVLGIPLSLLLGRGIASQLFRIAGWDPPSFIIAIALATVVVALAGYLPARRASRLEPVRALKS